MYPLNGNMIGRSGSLAPADQYSGYSNWLNIDYVYYAACWFVVFLWARAITCVRPRVTYARDKVTLALSVPVYVRTLGSCRKHVSRAHHTSSECTPSRLCYDA